MAMRMPAAFVGHGSPTIALNPSPITEAWSDFAKSAPRPTAIIAISAHWYINATAVTAMRRPRTIHDFFGFPEELFALEYPAPGDPERASQMIDVVAPYWLGLDVDSWGLDHGAWSVLVHMYPEADIPVLQLSLNGMHSFEDHVGIGAALAPLRDQGVMIVASGNIIHNGRALRRDHASAEAIATARRFDEAVAEVMMNDPGSAAKLAEHPDYLFAAPTPDHFLPVLYLAGLAAAANEHAEMIIDGPRSDALGMTAYRVN